MVQQIVLSCVAIESLRVTLFVSMVLLYRIAQYNKWCQGRRNLLFVDF